MKFLLNKYLILQLLFSLTNAEVFEGYVLFAPSSTNEDSVSTLLMDNEYNIIHSWTHFLFPASMPYLLSDSTLVYPYKVPNPTMTAGGVGGGVRKLSWDGILLWDYVFSDENYQHHHDVEPLPNGNVLVLVWDKRTAEEAYALGRETIQSSLNEMWSASVLELNPVTGYIDWEWHLWDHLMQDVNPDLLNFGAISEHPELFNINCGVAGTNAGGPQQENADWIHLNSVHYNASLDQIVLSSRLQNEIYIIDHSTTTEEAAGHSGGNSGKGGDILYRWGNPQNYNRGDESDKILSSQHSANWISESFPGENNLILFNNFHATGSSAVIEFTPPIDVNGHYIIEDNQPFGPVSWEWIYNCDIAVPMQGGAFRLENGNTLITQTHIATILEVDQNGALVWEYSHSAEGLGNVQENNYWIARSQKYGLNYLDSIILGDINSDGMINVLDVVTLINLILSNEGYNAQADVNFDGVINILDVVIMVNVILNGLP